MFIHSIPYLHDVVNSETRTKANFFQEYLTNILNYIILIGAIGLIIAACIPIVASGVAGANVSFGGTSIIIIVGVILETITTVKSMMTERKYQNVKGIF